MPLGVQGEIRRGEKWKKKDRGQGKEEGSKERKGALILRDEEGRHPPLQVQPLRVTKTNNLTWWMGGEYGERGGRGERPFLKTLGPLRKRLPEQSGIRRKPPRGRGSEKEGK